VSRVLRLNPVACAGHGACAELLPEVISLDEWGYPVLAPGPVPAGLARRARRAVAACPALALAMADSAPSAPSADSADSEKTQSQDRAGPSAGPARLGT
jgi:ferredoxin